MPSLFLLQSFVSLLALIQHVEGDCRSYGTDFVDKGGPYCVNTTSADFFSFGTIFDGCQASDVQDNTVTPILIDPSNDEYFCSDIPLLPNGVPEISVCNVDGNVVRKNQMVSGNWLVVIEGLTFAWMRAFSINAAPPVTVTTTPTATFSVTKTPVVTVTATSTHVVTSTLPPQTVTQPSTTLTVTSTITPSPVTTTITSMATFTFQQWAFSKTVVTKTVTKSCQKAAIAYDRRATVAPSKASAAAASISATTTAKVRSTKPRPRFARDPEWAAMMRREASDRGLLNEPRAVDACSTTVLATTNLPSVTVTITAPASSLVLTTDVTSTATATPAPVTSFSGRASTTITTTKPTQTITKTSRGITTTVVTNTIWATLTAYTTTKLPGCL